MPSRPQRKRERSSATREANGTTPLRRLFDVGPYHRNEITLHQINQLRDLIDREGVPRAAELVGVSTEPLLRVCCGFGHKLRPQTATKIREYFGG